MNRRYINLIIILILAAVAIWVDLPHSQPLKIGNFTRTMQPVLGLDLRGGMRVLLEAKPESMPNVNPTNMETTRQILENRSNGLGVTEVLFQVAGTNRIVGEFPGYTDADEVINSLRGTGLLEFVDLGSTPLDVGTVIMTDFGLTEEQIKALTPTVPPENTNGDPADSQPGTQSSPTIYHTVMTGKELIGREIGVTTDQANRFAITFSLTPEGQQIFADHTANNIGKYLAIVLDKMVISSPVINSAIPDGQGEISGSFTVDEANALAVQLRYGSLPIGLDILQTEVIGPTLGQDSLNKSIVAGLIGFAIVTLFMIIYYRLPGVVAILSIIIYGLITFALYKLIPVTLTLPGIAGFLLSTGGALDANILIFERLKEELRAGRSLLSAIEIGWKRALPSIRDSNLATLITSVILFWFGSAFGASIVKGFAFTLLLGVLISLFAAFFITRTFLNLVIEFIDPASHQKWFGA